MGLQKHAQKGYSNTGLQKGYSKRVLTGAEKLFGCVRQYLRGTHGVLTGYSRGTHGVLTRAVDRTVRCAPPPGRGPTARSAAHVCGTTACYLKVGERHRTEGDLACDARRALAGHSPGTRRPSTARTEAHPSVSTAAAARVTVTHSDYARVRVRSADARADGHARANQRRRHQPAHARADLRADARAELRRSDR